MKIKKPLFRYCHVIGSNLDSKGWEAHKAYCPDHGDKMAPKAIQAPSKARIVRGTCISCGNAANECEC